MTINMDQGLKSITGEDMKKPDGSLISLKFVALEAILAEGPDSKMTGEMRYKNWSLGKKLQRGGNVDLSIDEVKTIKDAIGRHWMAPVLGPAWDAIEGTNG